MTTERTSRPCGKSALILGLAVAGVMWTALVWGDSGQSESAAQLVDAAATQPAGDQPSSTQPAMSIEPAVNPHWSAEGCRVCHPSGVNPVEPMNSAAIDALCLSCHDGRRAPREAHPVGRRFGTEQVKAPADWPLDEGRLACATCHAITSACVQERTRPTANAAFLRNSPNGVDLAFCAKCHVAAASSGQKQAYSPHRMLDEQGRPMTQACLFCHRDPAIVDRVAAPTGDALLRGDGVTLCAGCHRRHVEWFEPGHLGQIVTDAMRERAKRLELNAESSAAGATTRPAEERIGPLPLDRGGRIVCATCHNPHQAGLFNAGAVDALGGLVPGDEARGMDVCRLGKDVCRVCHD